MTHSVNKLFFSPQERKLQYTRTAITKFSNSLNKSETAFIIEPVANKKSKLWEVVVRPVEQERPLDQRS